MYYTYLWLRENGTPYYVGKGSGRRAFKAHRLHGKAPSEGKIIVQPFESEEDAFSAEKFLINFYGRKNLGTGCLINLTDGGEGLINVSEETRRRMSASSKGNKRSLGRVLSEITKRKIGDKARERGKLTEEHKMKIGVSGKGKKRPPRSADWCRKISIAATQRMALKYGPDRLKWVNGKRMKRGVECP